MACEDLLGHKNLKSTQITINIEHALFQTESDEFHVKVAQTQAKVSVLFTGLVCWL